MKRPSAKEMQNALAFVKDAIRFRPPGSQAARVLETLAIGVSDYCELQGVRDEMDLQEASLEARLKALQEKEAAAGRQGTASQVLFAPVIERLDRVLAALAKK